MKIVTLGIMLSSLTLLSACGADSEEPNLTQQSEQSAQ